MSLPIADYALIGDTRTTALISRHGSVDWLCWPRHDSPALFLRLLDEDKGGSCSIMFDVPARSTRRYLPGTNILETSFTTPSGRASLLDFMPVHSPETLPDQGPDSDAETRLIRILRCDQGEMTGHFLVRPTFDYARIPCHPTRQANGSVLYEAKGNRLRVTASQRMSIEADQITVPFRLPAGASLHLVLTQGDDQAAPIEGPRDALERFETTHAYWEAWSARCRYDGPYRDAVLRSVLCLKLLTYAPTGAIIAAPTTSLPEAVPGDRNFDYRFAWLRDASFSVTSFAGLGYAREAAEYLHFLHNADQSRGRDLRLMYGIDGDVPSEDVLTHLAGWRGVRPVRIGNAAVSQHQHDIYGEFLLALHAYLDAIDDYPSAPPDTDLVTTLCNLVERVTMVRHDKDQGIWELRTGAQHMFHTKALLWVALDRAVQIGHRLGCIDAPRLAAWQAEADDLRAEYLDRGWNAERGAYTQAYGSDVLDAAVLRTVLFGAIPPDDPRLCATLAAIGRELGAGDLLYRYRAPDGLTGNEATFTACAFWRVGCMGLAGRIDEARALFERLLKRANDVGLFAEEIDADSGEQRGNFPQGFTHMAVINHALRLRRLTQTPPTGQARDIR